MAKQPKQTQADKPETQEERQPLTDREEWVCREFVADSGENQTRAYMKVFKGCSYDSARVQASQLFAKVNMRQRIDELREERNKRLEITADKVLAGIAKLAFYDSRCFFDDNGKLKPIGELDPDQSDVIAGIETFHKVTGDESDEVAITTKIKLADRGQNLERLGKHLKLFTDKTELTGAGGGPVTVKIEI
jgi:phage terminase small subunit